MPRRKIQPADPEDFVEIDRIIHEPARLIIMVNLAAVEAGDYLFLINQTGMTWGNLSIHMKKLAEVGYVEIHKEFVENRPHTMASITEKGRRALFAYVASVKDIINEVKPE